MIAKSIQFVGIVAMLWAFYREDESIFILGAILAFVGSHFDKQEVV